MLTERVRRWRDEGAVEKVFGRRLLVQRRGGGEGPLLLFLHGFPSSSYGGQRIAHRTIHYMTERERFTDRWHGAIREWPGRLTFAWGMGDPVARVELLRGLQDLRPGAPAIELPDAAHYPQIERPDLISAALDEAVT